jgi:L-glutamine:2-deoxy-scyllo-inosose/3-amino-2,3-dideoxy-scyllo-inosose aminotransferase
MNNLAINGGSSVRSDEKKWPKWPQYTASTIAQLTSVLESGRWTISGRWTGVEAKESEFARQWACFNSVPYCVLTPSGTTALTISLEALDIRAGDEVIIPGLTWVATASAVVNVNAVPILVDIDYDTLCLRPEAVEAAITSRTQAILPVHLYSCMADMDALRDIARRHNLAILEDCAQAHGASWRGMSAGSLGDLGAFSMQQNKVLTAGEGGAVITKDPDLYDRLQELRTDGRRVRSPKTLHPGEMQLVDSGHVLGSNYCMSEFHAAILLDQLSRLEAQNRLREANANYLNRALKDIGIHSLLRLPQMEKQTYYSYVIHSTPEAFADRPASVVCRALEAELGCPVKQPYKPLNDNSLYCPQSKHRYMTNQRHWDELDPRRFSLPDAERAYQQSIVFPHWTLLGSCEDMQDIVEAVAKVRLHAAELPGS